MLDAGGFSRRDQIGVAEVVDRGGADAVAADEAVDGCDDRLGAGNGRRERACLAHIAGHHLDRGPSQVLRPSGLPSQYPDRHSIGDEQLNHARSQHPRAAGDQDHQAQRRVGAANVVGDLLGKGSLREGLEEGAAADIVWVLNDPGLYHQLVERQGWKPERFETWLAESMGRLLLPDQSNSGKPALP